MSRGVAWGLGPFGGTLKVVTSRSTGKKTVACVKPSTSSNIKESKCSCSRCFWNSLSAKERFHREDITCFCTACEHRRDAGVIITSEVKEAANTKKEETQASNDKDETKISTKLTDEQLNELIEMKLRHVGLGKIASKLSISKQDVRNIWESIPEEKKLLKVKKSQENTESETKDQGKNKDQDKDRKKSVTVEVKIPTTDELFDKTDILVAQQIILNESKSMWSRVAEKFYDSRGKLYHPDDFKLKFTGQVG